MPDGAPPPWLINMQRYGPPPSYPNLRIAGLNAPIPDGASFGYHPGGWGKPPVDEYGRPLYGDVFGAARAGAPPEPSMKPADTGGYWGELADDDDDDDDYPADEGFEAVDDDAYNRTNQPPPRASRADLSSVEASETSGIETPLDTEGLSSAVSGLETPDAIDLRKRAGLETPDSSSGVSATKALYQVLDEEKARARGGAGTLFASEKRYKVAGAGVEASLDPSQLEGGLADQVVLRDKYAQGAGGGDDDGIGDVLAEGSRAQKRRIDSGRDKAAKKRKDEDSFKF